MVKHSPEYDTKIQVIRSIGKLSEEVDKLHSDLSTKLDLLLKDMLRLLAPSHDEMKKISRRYPAPQEWYDEDY